MPWCRESRTSGTRSRHSAGLHRRRSCGTQWPRRYADQIKEEPDRVKLRMPVLGYDSALGGCAYAITRTVSCANRLNAGSASLMSGFPLHHGIIDPVDLRRFARNRTAGIDEAGRMSRPGAFSRSQFSPLRSRTISSPPRGGVRSSPYRTP